MIKATGTVVGPDGARPALFLCLLPGNTERLVQGDPIVFEAGELGLPPMRVVILYEHDADAVRAKLAPMMRADATHSPEPLEEQFVDWRSVAGDLAAAAVGVLEQPSLAAAGSPDGRPAQLTAALGRWRAALQREGL